MAMEGLQKHIHTLMEDVPGCMVPVSFRLTLKIM